MLECYLCDQPVADDEHADIRAIFETYDEDGGLSDVLDLVHCSGRVNQFDSEGWVVVCPRDFIHGLYLIGREKQAAEARRPTLEQRYTEYEIDDIGDESLGEAWVEVIAGRGFEGGFFADFGFADTVVGCLRFTDGTFETGVGSPLRPYRQLYLGDDRDKAEEAFVHELAELGG